jgi:competence protein ComEC
VALIVTARQAPRDCAAATIDQGRLYRQGALALWRKGRGFEIDAVRPRGYDRPWSPAPAGEAETDASTIARPAVPRAIDTTPSETDLQADD